MKHIAIYCVSYESDQERDNYIASVQRASQQAKDKVLVEIFIANNTRLNNPGYFGAVRRLMLANDPSTFDYVIISNVDVTVNEDFFVKLVDYECASDIGWIAPRIWSDLEQRDRNPGVMTRYTKRKLQIHKLFYKFPILEWLYTCTFYRRKKLQQHTAGTIYAGHGSFIILTHHYLSLCGIIDYPLFLYGEELYLAEYCRLRNLRVEYVPTIQVFDSEHISTGKMSSLTKNRYEYQAVRYILKNFY